MRSSEGKIVPARTSASGQSASPRAGDTVCTRGPCSTAGARADLGCLTCRTTLSPQDIREGDRRQSRIHTARKSHQSYRRDSDTGLTPGNDLLRVQASHQGSTGSFWSPAVTRTCTRLEAPVRGQEHKTGQRGRSLRGALNTKEVTELMTCVHGYPESVRQMMGAAYWTPKMSIHF